MIEKKRYQQFSNTRKQKIKGITIHNTNNAFSAKENIELMLKSNMNFSANVFIDENEVVEVLPATMASFHTGKANDKGNRETLSIEICRSTCSMKLYLQAQRRAIQWIKETLKEYELDTTAIYFHQDFDQRAYCPHRILEVYGNKKNFIEKEMK